MSDELKNRGRKLPKVKEGCMKVTKGKSYRCPIGLQGIPTKDGEIVTVEDFVSTPYGMEIKLNGERKMNVMLSLFKKPFFESI